MTTANSVRDDVAHVRYLYLDLMKRCLIDSIYAVERQELADAAGEAPPDPDALSWPPTAHTMIGWARLENIQDCLEQCIHDGVPGDFIETGVWRGGACIFARAILKAWGEDDRTVWVADSFAGLPPPDAAQYPWDTHMTLHEYKDLAISLPDVQKHFRRYDLLDTGVRFLKGWFRDTLPGAPMTQLAVMRLDGDMYESTMDGLVHLYPKLSPGGFVVVDDYGLIHACKQAVHDYRDEHGITDEIQTIDETGVFWRRSA